MTASMASSSSSSSFVAYGTLGDDSIAKNYTNVAAVCSSEFVKFAFSFHTYSTTPIKSHNNGIANYRRCLFVKFAHFNIYLLSVYPAIAPTIRSMYASGFVLYCAVETAESRSRHPRYYRGHVRPVWLVHKCTSTCRWAKRRRERERRRRREIHFVLESVHMSLYTTAMSSFFHWFDIVSKILHTRSARPWTMCCWYRDYAATNSSEIQTKAMLTSMTNTSRWCLRTNEQNQNRWSRNEETKKKTQRKINNNKINGEKEESQTIFVLKTELKWKKLREKGKTNEWHDIYTMHVVV